MLMNRLKQIEDILGEDYDLDHLKELVEADRNHLMKEQKTQTNADKIRSMTDEELYDFLCSFASRGGTVMRIIKHGNPNKIVFECPWCGCVFKACKGEYTVYSSQSGIKTWAACEREG